MAKQNNSCKKENNVLDHNTNGGITMRKKQLDKNTIVILSKMITNNTTFITMIRDILEQLSFELLNVRLDEVGELEKTYDSSGDPEALFCEMLCELKSVSDNIQNLRQLCGLPIKEETFHLKCSKQGHTYIDDYII